MQRKFWSVVGAVVAMCTGAAAMAQAPVGNPGYETDIAQNTVVPDNWGTFYGGPPTSVLFANNVETQFRTGTRSLRLFVGGDGNAFCGVQQTVGGLSGGLDYQFRIWAKKGALPNENGIDIKIEWVNATGGNTGGIPILNPSLTDDWVEYVVQGTAPADAVSARLVLAVQSFTFNPVNPVFNTEAFFDDASLVLAPNQNLGRCCGAEGACSVTNSAGCTGTFTAGGVCTPNTCPGAPGACCNRRSGVCVTTVQTLCSALGGVFAGPGVTCSPTNCTACPSDFNGSGTATVQDIFDFLTAYFAGC